MNHTQNNPKTSCGDYRAPVQITGYQTPVFQAPYEVVPYGSLTPGPVSFTPSVISREGPPPVSDINYIPGFLASNIGKNVKAEFILGMNQFIDKTGKLTDVGVNYFVLQDINSRTNIMCDLYSVKFVTILY